MMWMLLMGFLVGSSVLERFFIRFYWSLVGVDRGLIF